jgi:hypothetical protein
LVAGLVLTAAIAGGCADLCENQPLQEVPSPDGKLSAILFQRSCGATTGYSTHVSIVTAEEDVPEGGGNAFVADNGHSDAPAGPSGGPG